MHCENNLYSWSDAGPFEVPDGTAFTEFLWALNNTCSEDALVPFKDLEACDVKARGCTESCGFSGYTYWEVPNIKKLQSIVDHTTHDPATSLLGATASSFSWSATTWDGDHSFAWGGFFVTGEAIFGDKSASHAVRGVRIGDLVV